MWLKVSEIDPITVALTDEIINKAKYHQKELMKQHSRFNVLNEDCDLIGSIAQQVVEEQIRLWGYDPKMELFYNPDIRSDRFDLYWRDEFCDVKGSPMGTKDDGSPFYVGAKSRFLMDNSKVEKHKDKGITKYIFVKVSVEHGTSQIAGVISLSDFWNKGKDASEQGMRVKVPTTYVTTEDLIPFRRFILE